MPIARLRVLFVLVVLAHHRRRVVHFNVTEHPFTFRSEQRRLVSDYAGNPSNEYLMFYELGVDGVFTDFADDAVAARVLFLLKTDPSYVRCLVKSRCSKAR